MRNETNQGPNIWSLFSAGSGFEGGKTLPKLSSSAPEVRCFSLDYSEPLDGSAMSCGSSIGINTFVLA